MNSKQKNSATSARRQGPSQKKAKKALLNRVHTLLNIHFQQAFKRRSTFQRLTDLMLGLIAGVGQKTLASALTILGEDQGIYATHYQVFSEATWSQQDLFRGVFRASVPLVPERDPLVVALDDTPLDKTSYSLPFARWCHNGCGPKWVRPSLKWGMPCSHAALLIATRENFRASAISLSFDPIPGKSTKRKKRRNGAKRGRPRKDQSRPSIDNVPGQTPKATEVAVQTITRIRGWMDAEGMKHRLLWMVVDGSYVNRTVIEGLPTRTILVGRARKDAVLFKPLEEKDGKRIYGEPLPTPESLGKDPMIPSLEASFSYGGAQRKLRYKELPHPVLWRYGTRGTRLRLLILMPVPYGGGRNKDGTRKKLNYNERAYLLTTDLVTPAPRLIQAYLDRWQIEVLHRNLKHDVGLGQDQCRNPRSVERVHAALVAVYAMLNVAALETYGPVRTDVFPALPRWRRDYENSRLARRVTERGGAPVLRPSVQDIITLLREQMLIKWIQGKAKIR